MKPVLTLFFFSARVSGDEDLEQFMSTVLSLLREVESEMENVRSNQQRAEFYGNRLLCAFRHLSNILAHMQRLPSRGSTGSADITWKHQGHIYFDPATSSYARVLLPATN